MKIKIYSDSVGIYLAANIARHPNYLIIYQDIDPLYHCDIGGSMLDVDLSPFDFIIATPPCNFWSKLNFSYLTSQYALKTRNLLPDTIKMLAGLNKPFLIENVKNITRFEKYGIFDLIRSYGLFTIIHGRHIYISNFDISFLKTVYQIQDFKYGGIRVNQDGYNQGGTNVHNIIEAWLEYIHNNVIDITVYKQLNLFGEV